MKRTFVIGFGFAAAMALPALAAESAAMMPVHHHHVHRHIHRTIGPVADRERIQNPQSPGTKATVETPSVEWDCNGGDGGCTWEPYGWRRDSPHF